jgi:hypothetical protein
LIVRASLDRVRAALARRARRGAWDEEPAWRGQLEEAVTWRRSRGVIAARGAAAAGDGARGRGAQMLESLIVTVDIYRRSFARAAALAIRNWAVLGSVFAYAALLAVGGVVAAQLGLVGGLLYSLLLAACAGSFLYLVEMMVRTGRVTWEDFGRSFGAYLWDVVGVNFVLWIFWQLAMPVLNTLPQGRVIVLSIELIIVVLFNALPELIYLGHCSLLQLFSRSYEFIGSNWIEWFPPNVLLIALLTGLWALPAPGAGGRIAQTALAALFLYFAMVVRGLLFIELDGSSRRSRIFRHKMGR